MPLPVYSKVFIEAKSAPSVSGSYVVPAGFVAVVRDVEYFNSGGTGPSFFTLQDVASGSLIAAGTATLPASSWQWQGRQVYEPGAEFIATMVGPSGSVAVSVRVSGYLLTLP